MPKKYFKDQTIETRDEYELLTRYTLGLAVPRKGSRRACLCEDKETYSTKCCREYLINQGIGAVEGAPLPTFAFHRPDFPNAFS